MVSYFLVPSFIVVGTIPSCTVTYRDPPTQLDALNVPETPREEALYIAAEVRITRLLK